MQIIATHIEEWVAFLLDKIILGRHLIMQNRNKLFSTVNVIKMALLAVIAVILMQFGGIKLPVIFPNFLELDFSEIPAIIGILTIHPLAGVVVVILKNVLKVVLFQSTTAYVGELANMTISLGYILPLTFMMRKNKNLRYVSIGMGLGVITMTIMGAIINYFITLPLYAKLFMPMDSIINMGHVIYAGIIDKGTLVLYSIIPFNLVKGTLLAIASMLIIKGMGRVIVQLGYRSDSK